MIGKLIVAGVGIGNVLDIPRRTIEAIKSSKFVVTESKKYTQEFIHYLNIETQATLIEYLPWFEQPNVNKNQHIVDKIVDILKSGDDVLLVSTEGMPLIHDPGYEIVLEVRKNNIPITVIPGPSAPIAALNISGLDSWKFVFESDMPTNDIEKEKALRKVKYLDMTSIFFEKDVNLLNTLEKSIFIISGLRPACVCINLTMPDELVIRGTLQEIFDWFKDKDFIGDFEEQKKIVFLIAGTNYFGNENENNS